MKLTRNKLLRTYQNYLKTIFVLWLFLWLVGKININFGVSLSSLFRIFLFMFLVLVLQKLILSRQKMSLFIRSIYFQSQLFSKLKSLPSFSDKIIYLFSLIISSPLKVIKKIYLSGKKISYLCIIGILINFYLTDLASEVGVLIITGLWIRLISIYKIKGKVSIVIGLLFLSLCPLLLIINKDNLAEKTATWAYMFLLISVCQMIIKYQKQIKMRMINE